MLLREAPSLPEERIAQEVALLAARFDVREELDRLASHIEAAHALLREAANIGRRLDFLMQEFNREANTLCGLGFGRADSHRPQAEGHHRAVARAGAEYRMSAIARRGVCLVLSAPSGAGKTAIADALLASEPELRRSVSVTTRAPRDGEADGVHYYFRDQAAFDRMVAAGELLEWARVLGRHCYGTPRAPVRQAIREGKDMVFDIDWQGHRKLRAALPEDVVGVFILPPTLTALESRLRRRSVTIQRRSRAAWRWHATRIEPLAGVRPRGGERRPGSRGHHSARRATCGARGNAETDRPDRLRQAVLTSGPHRALVARAPPPRQDDHCLVRREALSMSQISDSVVVSHRFAVGCIDIRHRGQHAA